MREIFGARAFIEELRQRSVFRVGLMYGAVGWAVADVSSTVLPHLNAPGWITSVVIVLVLLGFPVALVLAWAFDLTPEGVRRAPRSRVGRRAGAVGVTGAKSETRVVALPFTDRSHAGEHQYLGDGITDELITALTRASGLQVISRTSAFSVRDAGLDVLQIGQRLGADCVIEGTLRVAAGRLRLAVQLTDAHHGHVVWSSSFDHAVADVFSMQEQIARDVVSALAARLRADVSLAEDAVPQATTANFEAWSEYLRGRQRWNERTPASLARAVRHFETAIARDPGFAQGHAGLADAWGILVDHGISAPAEGIPRARAAALTALHLAPGLAEAHSACALVHQLTGDVEAAEAGFRQAIACDPGAVVARQRLALLLAWSGRCAEARAEAQAALQLDPISPLIGATRAWIEYFDRRYEDAISCAQSVLHSDPGAVSPRIPLALALLQTGAAAEAATVLDAAAATAEDSVPLLGLLAHARAAAGDEQGADAARSRIEERQAEPGFVSPYALATAWLGVDDERAIAALGEAARLHVPQLVCLPRDPLFDGVKCDARIGLIARSYAAPPAA